MSSSNEEVLAAAEELGEALREAQREQSRFQFNSLLMRSNDAISRDTGIDYGSACGAGGSC